MCSSAGRNHFLNHWSFSPWYACTRLSTLCLVLVHGPVHASWLNQIEIYFSIIQRKVVTSNDFPSLKELEQRILNFQQYYEQIAKPFEWKFTREDLNKLLK